MSAKHGTFWFWSDWLGDQSVRRLTPAERGVWIDLLALAAVANPTGYVCDDRGRALTDAEIARVTNAGTEEEVAKLIAGILDKGAASRDRSGRLYNRRMVRKMESVAQKRLAGHLGGVATQLKWHGELKNGRQTLERSLKHHDPPLTNPIKKERKEEGPASEGSKGSIASAALEAIMREKRWAQP